MEAVLALLQEIASRESPLQCNKHQAQYLVKCCSTVGDYVEKWRKIMEVPPATAMEELECLLRGALNLVKQNSGDQWLLSAALRGESSKAFAKACLGLSRCTELIDTCWFLFNASESQVELASLYQPYKHEKYEESINVALKSLAEQDKQELLQKTIGNDDNDDERSMLAQHLHYKLLSSVDDKPELPLISPVLLETMIGSGAFSSIFKGRWLGMPVAVKEFRSPGDTTFYTEVRLCRELTLEPDPHILQIIGYYFHNSRSYLVMELMEGDLAKVMREQGPLPLASCIDIMIQVAGGMCVLHDRNIVHRDLKPQNILVNSSGGYYDVKIADFGYSRTDFISYAPDLTYQRGTMSYMAPEMFRGVTYSREVDVYSFGMTSFHLLTGNLPFTNSKQKHGGRKVLELVEAGGRPELPLHWPKELALLINRCWNSNPKDRPSFTSISKSLISLRDKLLSGHYLYLQNLENCFDELGAAASDMIKRIVMLTPTVNFHQCKFLQSRCAYLLEWIRLWSKVDLGGLNRVIKTLVSVLKRAFFLVESCCKETLALKQCHPSYFNEVLEIINWCIDELNEEGARTHSGVHRLKQFAEEDKKRLLQNITTALPERTQLNQEEKVIQYLHKKYNEGTSVPYIDPNEITLREFAGFSSFGPVFTARWLGNRVTLKTIGSTATEGRQLLKEAEVQAARTTEGPNILQIMGFSKHMEQLMLVTDYANTRLRNSVSTALFPPVLAIEILYQLARAVKWLHSNNVGHGDIRAENISIDFEEVPSYGFTGNIIVKLEMPYRVHGTHEVHVLKKLDSQMFGITCSELFAACNDELPSPMKMLIDMCSSSEPPNFREISEMVQSLKLELDAEAEDIDYRQMMQPHEQEVDTAELQIRGRMIIGEKLKLIENTIQEGRSRLYQWVRHDKNGGVERLPPFLVTNACELEYTLTADDFDKAISCTYIDIDETMEPVGTRHEITNVYDRWVTCKDSVKSMIKMARNRGHATFNGKMDGGKCYLDLNCSGYVLKWRKMLQQKQVKDSFYRIACIKLGAEDTFACLIVSTSGKTWEIRFKDAATRDLVVLTFRHFMRSDALSRGSRRSGF